MWAVVVQVVSLLIGVGGILVALAWAVRYFKRDVVELLEGQRQDAYSQGVRDGIDLAAQYGIGRAADDVEQAEAIKARIVDEFQHGDGTFRYCD